MEKQVSRSQAPRGRPVQLSLLFMVGSEQQRSVGLNDGIKLTDNDK